MRCQGSNPGLLHAKQMPSLLYPCSGPLFLIVLLQEMFEKRPEPPAESLPHSPALTPQVTCLLGTGTSYAKVTSLPAPHIQHLPLLREARCRRKRGHPSRFSVCPDMFVFQERQNPGALRAEEMGGTEGVAGSRDGQGETWGI